ncbi:MAG: thiamine-binding protein [Chloroflexi bacterium]|nr:thiamine-binding protein [Chloroflexota bacterium]MBC7331108.1 thiamine-binding protein [Synergistota bacterium]
MVRADLRILPATGDKDKVIKLVDKAINIIEASGISHEVTPTCTLLMGSLDQILALVKKIHEELSKENICFLTWELRVFEFKP